MLDSSPHSARVFFVWRGAAETLLPQRKCRAGRCAPRPGAGRKMTSSGLWLLSKKYENGKTAEETGEKKKQTGPSWWSGGGRRRRRRTTGQRETMNRNEAGAFFLRGSRLGSDRSVWRLRRELCVYPSVPRLFSPR